VWCRVSCGAVCSRLCRCSQLTPSYISVAPAIVGTKKATAKQRTVNLGTGKLDDGPKNARTRTQLESESDGDLSDFEDWPQTEENDEETNEHINSKARTGY
jgi:hypothetical protein